MASSGDGARNPDCEGREPHRDHALGRGACKGYEADAHGQRLQEIYEAWCHGQGHKRPVRWDVLAKSIQRAIPGAQWTVVSVGNQKQRGFRGLPLRGRLLTTTPDAPATQGGIWQH